MLTDREYKRADWILGKAHTNPEDLSPWEENFVDDMTDRIAKYGKGLSLSEKQWDVLGRIADKAI